MDESALQSARELIATGRFAEAAQALDALRRRFPGHAEATHAWALALGQLGLHDRALAAFAEALALAPADPALLVNAGAAQLRAGRTSEAVATLRRATAIDPSLAGAHSNLAQALTAAGDLETAARHFHEAARLFPDASTFWRDVGRAEARLGRWDAAIEAYRKASSEDEDCHLDARQELAAALEEGGRTEEALSSWRSMMAKAPLLPSPRNHVVSLLARLERLEEAEAIAHEGTELAPTHADFHHNLGAIRAMRGDIAGAVAAWRRALLHDPGRAESALAAAEGLPLPTEHEIDYASPFEEGEHRIGVLTFRIHSPDDLSRALAHALPAALATARVAGASVAHVAAFERGTARRADVVGHPLDLETARMADLTRNLRVERWIAGEVAPDLASVRVLTWTAGSVAVQSADFPLDPQRPEKALAGLAEFARLPWPPGDLPDSRALLHYGHGATAIVEELAFEHLLAALRGAAFGPVEAEFGRLLVPLLERGDGAGALAWIERALGARPSGRFHALKGQALYAAGDFDGARAAWAAAAGFDPALRMPALVAGWMALREKNVAEAEARFREAKGVEGDAGAALVGLGVCAMARDDGEGARRHYMEALQLVPRMPEALFQMAVSWWMDGNEAEAVAWGGRLEAHHEGHGLVVALGNLMTAGTKGGDERRGRTAGTKGGDERQGRTAGTNGGDERQGRTAGTEGGEGGRRGG